jgi:hypothetical protein
MASGKKKTLSKKPKKRSAAQCAASAALGMRNKEKITGLEAAIQLYLLNTSQYPLPSDPEADMEGDALTVDPEIVDDWGAEEDIEMEE